MGQNFDVHDTLGFLANYWDFRRSRHDCDRAEFGRHLNRDNRQAYFIYYHRNSSRHKKPIEIPIGVRLSESRSEWHTSVPCSYYISESEREVRLEDHFNAYTKMDNSEYFNWLRNQESYKRAWDKFCCKRIVTFEPPWRNFCFVYPGDTNREEIEIAAAVAKSLLLYYFHPVFGELIYEQTKLFSNAKSSLESVPSQVQKAAKTVLKFLEQRGMGGSINSRISHLANGELPSVWRRVKAEKLGNSRYLDLDLTNTQLRTLFVVNLIVELKYLMWAEKSDKQRFPADVIAELGGLVDYHHLDQRTVILQMERLESQPDLYPSSSLVEELLTRIKPENLQDMFFENFHEKLSQDF